LLSIKNFGHLQIFLFVELPKCNNVGLSHGQVLFRLFFLIDNSGDISYRYSGSVVSCSASSITLLAILTNWPPSDSLMVVLFVVGVPLGAVVLFIVVPVLVGVSKRMLKNNGE